MHGNQCGIVGMGVKKLIAKDIRICLSVILTSTGRRKDTPG